MAWKEAASLLITAAPGPGHLFKVLLMRRSAGSSFMPNLFVFPGGQLDQADTSPEWLEQFSALGLFAETARSAAARRPRAPMLTDHEKSASVVPGELSFRLCALRETFEECGLLLAARGPRQPVTQSNISGMDRPEWDRWRERVRNDASAFLTLHKELQLMPDVWSLREWSNWLTPIQMKKRFDTVFFIFCAQSGIEELNERVMVDETELSVAKWLTPDDYLRNHFSGALQLAPPQVYELARLEHFTDITELDTFAEERERQGNVRICPYIVKASNGVYSLFPGDFRFPGDEVASHAKEVLPVEESFENDVGKLNRYFMSGKQVLCNVSICGHVPPVVFVGHHDSKL